MFIQIITLDLIFFPFAAVKPVNPSVIWEILPFKIKTVKQFKSLTGYPMAFIETPSQIEITFRLP